MQHALWYIIMTRKQTLSVFHPLAVLFLVCDELFSLTGPPVWLQTFNHAPVWFSVLVKLWTFKWPFLYNNLFCVGDVTVSWGWLCLAEKLISLQTYLIAFLFCLKQRERGRAVALSLIDKRNNCFNISLQSFLLGLLVQMLLFYIRLEKCYQQMSGYS